MTENCEGPVIAYESKRLNYWLYFTYISWFVDMLACSYACFCFIIILFSHACIVPDNPPSNFTATAINSTAIQLLWSEPLTPYGVVVSYNITYNLSDVIEIGSGMNLLIMDFTAMPVSLMVDAEDGNSYVVAGLNEYTVYQFEIFASTRIGPGPSTQATARTHDTSKSGVGTSKYFSVLHTLSSIDVHFNSWGFMYYTL